MARTTTNNVVEAPKRGRGRPAKNPVAAVVEAPKRGRPAKNPVAVEKAGNIFQFDNIIGLKKVAEGWEILTDQGKFILSGAEVKFSAVLTAVKVAAGSVKVAQDENSDFDDEDLSDDEDEDLSDEDENSDFDDEDLSDEEDDEDLSDEEDDEDLSSDEDENSDFDDEEEDENSDFDDEEEEDENSEAEEDDENSEDDWN